MTVRRRPAEPVTILLIDEDPARTELTARVLRSASRDSRVACAARTDEALADLRREDGPENAQAAPTPSLILLNMPHTRGAELEALKRLKRNPATRTIPVVVLGLSDAEDDIREAYQHGANSYLVTPTAGQPLEQLVEDLSRFWLDHAVLQTQEIA